MAWYWRSNTNHSSESPSQIKGQKEGDALQQSPSASSLSSTETPRTSSASLQSSHQFKDSLLEDAQKLWNEMSTSPGTSPYPMWANATLLALSALKSRNRTGLLQRPFLLGFGAIYGGVGYILSYDDTHGPQLGAGWGSIYLMLCAPAALRSRQLIPMALVSSISTATYFYVQEALD